MNFYPVVTNSSMHMRNTRYCDLNLLCPRCNYATEDGHSFTVRSIKDWNPLPRPLRVLDSYSHKKKPFQEIFSYSEKGLLTYTVFAT